MAFSAEIQSELDVHLLPLADVSSRRMFGAAVYLVRDKMFAFIHNHSLVVKLPPEDGAKAMASDGVRPYNHGHVGRFGDWMELPLDGPDGVEEMVPWILGSYQYVQLLSAGVGHAVPAHWVTFREMLGRGKSGMNLLVVGSGAREHAIAWKLSSSARVGCLFIAPGNAATGSIGTNLAGSPDDLEGLASLVEAHDIDLTVVGPEVPLAAGVVDMFQQRGFPIFGPTRAAAQLEASKSFAKELMREHGIPCPEFWVFRSHDEAHSFLSGHEGPVW